MGKARTIFIGDVHGCLEELKDLVRTIDVSKHDRIIMLGDLINRGPYSEGVIQYVYSKGWECLMGNHEYEYLEHFRTSDKFRKMWKEIGPKAHRWVEELPLFIEDDQFLAVHAGVEPGKHPSLSEARILLNIRTWDGTGYELKNPKNPPWYSFYDSAKPAFYGHWAVAGLNLRVNTFGLDSGCVYGKALSAYVLEEKRLIQVPARRVHYIPPGLRKPAAFSV
ncbi:MAG: metallophosphoesterase [Spirochaetia bacterium]|nr:metallophosphoesterase [Spirochaetia bacterium]